MCPHFPKGDVDKLERPLAWEQVEQELATSKHYRLCSVRPDGRPHAVLRWAVWVEGRIYDDGSPETRHARNIALNPNVSVHLESGVRAVMLEGAASAMKPSHELAVHIADEYTAKYPALGYAPKPDSWDAGGLFASTPQRVIAWTSFAEAPTKFVLDAAPG